jgi:hypothetical protein
MRRTVFGDFSATQSAFKWAAGLSLYVIVIRFGRGAAAFQGKGFTFTGALVTYWLAATVIGLSLDSFLRKLRNSLLGYIAAGFIVLIPVALIANYSLLPKVFAGVDLLAFIFFVALLLGCTSGAVAWVTRSHIPNSSDHGT